MFFFVFFQRPPPTQTAPGKPILITPKVANDLRTEDFPGGEELYYAWSLAGPSLDSGAEPYPSLAAPQKLTTWRAGNYKELPVPFPPRAHDGQSYRLLLTTRPHPRAHIINLAARDVGSRPMPVMSMPIRLDGRARPGQAEKQQEIERVYRVPLGPDKDGFLKIREQTSYDLDKKVWDSGIGLSSWLVELAHIAPGEDGHSLVQHARDVLLSPHKRNIVELGAGTGIVSLTLGALRSARTTDDEGIVLTTDLESALPLLTLNVAANDMLFSAGTRPRPLPLDWDNDLPEDVRAIEGGFDAIIMADVTYNTSSFPALVKTLSSLLQLSPLERRPTLILGYKERDPDERVLWNMARDVGVMLERVGERAGAGREPVEIWVGRLE
ncbi:putative methyltransferase-domain-containing protein [Epithele typhae]|uniref:putative methyltransferase-domain-containing protein n=1 Tax=Epithele typhae TaxID=378194 RepID=UPI002007BEF6|nr:putative methyltransferase-domain-containing protein [Epithele typhae]KAH9921687.1 putative methyltransferase-domain-containing protein [Epithele typhae]